MKLPEKSSTEKRWDRPSSEYQSRHKIPTSYIHYGPYCPTEDELQLLGELKGKNVIELGCGGGQCSIIFAKKGAKVIGVDLSGEQLSFARRLAREEGMKVEFLKSNVEDLSMIPEGSQDIAFSAYAFQYVQDIRRAFDEVYRILRSGGILAFSLDHPFSWCFPEGMSELKVVRSYFEEEPRLGNLGREHPRSLSQLFNALFDSGFIVVKIVEPKPERRNDAVDNWPEYSLDGLMLVPGTVIFKALKPHGFSDLLRVKGKDDR